MSDLHANYDNNQGEIVIYQSENGDTKIDVRFVDETVWLTQQQMAELFHSSRVGQGVNLSEIPTGSNGGLTPGYKGNSSL